MEKNLTHTQKTKQKLVEIKEIPDEIYGVKLSELDKERLSYGTYSSLKEHFTLPNGSVKDGKVKLVLNNKDGEAEYHFLFHKETLEIPEKIGGKKLTGDQVEDLKAGKTVLLIIDDNDLYVKVDIELNCVSVSTGKELGIPDEMGGYKLTYQDKEKLSNKEPIGARVFKGKDGYFIANIKLSKDNKEMIFMDIKSIDRENDVERFIETLNKKEVATTKIKIGQEITQEEKIIANKNKSVANAIDVAVNSTIVNPDVAAAIKQRDYKLLNILRKEGKIGAADVKFVKEDKELTKEDKSIALTIIGEKDNVEQQKKEFYKAVDQKNPEKIKELTDKGFTPEKEELDYIVTNKAMKPEEKKEMLSTLNVTPEEKQNSEIKIGKIEEQKLKAEKVKEVQKDNSKNKQAAQEVGRFVNHMFTGL